MNLNNTDVGPWYFQDFWLADYGSWPSGYQCAVAGVTGNPNQSSYTPTDWTGLTDGNGGISIYLLSMAMGNPLEPGTYYIGFYNKTGSVMTNCTFTSRAIGEGMSYSPTPIAFDGGSVAITNLPARGVAYFAVDVPTNVPSWKFLLENTGGETEVFVRKDRVPTIGAQSYPNLWQLQLMAGLNKTGDERFILTPEAGEGSLQVGRYYLMVVSQGQNPGTYIGTNNSSAVLRSLGLAPVLDLGTLPLVGTVERPDSYVAGDNRFYTFTIPTNALALEVRLLDRVGSPEIAIRNDGRWSRSGDPRYYYRGIYTPSLPQYADSSLFTVAVV